MRNNYLFTSNPSPRGIRIRSPTRFQTESWTPSSPRISTAGWPVRPSSPPASLSSPARFPPKPMSKFPISFAMSSKTSAIVMPPGASTSTPVRFLPRSTSNQATSPWVWIRAARATRAMFGYATNETTELMPMPIVLAHRLTRRLAECARKTSFPGSVPTVNRR